MAANPFKRAMPPLGTEGLVSGADRKKLRRQLEKALPHASEQDVEALLPAKGGALVSVKLSAPRREVVYKLDGVPVLLDSSGKGDLLPTVMGLWRAPTLLPQVHLKHPAVSQFIVGGADVMLPGSLLPTGGFNLPFDKGTLLAVCVPGNPCPIAVGVAGMSSDDAYSRTGGKLVEVLQAYGDCLWSVLGGRATPNDGFLPTAVVPIGLGAAGLDTSGYVDGEAGQPTQPAPVAGGVDGGPEAAPPDPAAAEETAGLTASPSSGGVTGADDATAGVGALQLGEGGEAPDRGATAASSPATPDSMDTLLEITLLQALHRTVKDAALPMTASVLWAQHVQPARPAGSTLDVKKSKHKKLSVFLKAYGGKNGLLSLKEDKHSGDQVVTAVNRDHPLFVEFRRYPLAATAGGGGDAGRMPDQQAGPAAPGAGPGAAAGAAGNGGADDGGRVVVEELWRPGKELRPLFEALGRAHDVLLTPQEAAEVALEYVAHAQLTANAPDDRTIVLDVLLCDALFKGVIKRGEMYPSVIAKAELKELFLKRCSTQTRVARGAEVALRKGPAPVVACSVKKRQGHTVTVIVGAEAFLVSPDTVAAECQRRFASACKVAALPGKNAGHEVIIQGNVTEHIAAFLVDKFGIPKRLITVKTG